MYFKKKKCCDVLSRDRYLFIGPHLLFMGWLAGHGIIIAHFNNYSFVWRSCRIYIYVCSFAGSSTLILLKRSYRLVLLFVSCSGSIKCFGAPSLPLLVKYFGAKVRTRVQECWNRKARSRTVVSSVEEDLPLDWLEVVEKLCAAIGLSLPDLLVMHYSGLCLMGFHCQALRNLRQPI